MQMKKVGVCICTPIPIIHRPDGSVRLEPITVEWHRARLALTTPTNWNFTHIQIDGLEVGEARNLAARTALASDPVPEFLFFLDYDVIPNHDALTKLVFRARCFLDHDIFAGVYVSKSTVPEPLIYSGDGVGGYWDWAIGDLLTDDKITSCHMGLTLIRTSLLQRMKFDDENPLFVTVNTKTEVRDGIVGTKCGTEDLYFCNRAIKEAGAKILVDTSVLAGHINNKTGQIFGLPINCLPVMRANKVQKLVTVDGVTTDSENTELLKALDLGAGDKRREWAGYKTFTTDLRKDTKPDFLVDTRMMNFPDATFDLVASSHHLEHVGRWHQEKVWSEIYRILKPGGKIEHIVPNLKWAAWKITDNDVDIHVYNVLYGGQEGPEWEGAVPWPKELNTHYFGYTPVIARELALQAGFVEVEVVSFEENPEMGYEIKITGIKPLVEEVPEVPTTEVTKLDSAEEVLQKLKNLVVPSKKKKSRNPL